ncbi:MAG: UDP-N-acetylmuramate dehydrogenase [Bacilli bacterium]|nr:UDP-N-acetylmuramate dehydrogenase [Bacilli bacterium]
MKEIINYIKKNSIGSFRENVSLSSNTTYKVGGIAKIFVYPKNADKLILLLKKLKDDNIKYKVIGYGSNLIFSDDVYDGVIIKLDNFDDVKIKDTIITVGAGVSLVKLSYKAMKEGLSGLEFASGIPGSVGGACFMNAGAYKSDMGYIVSEVKVITPELDIKTLYNKDLKYKYRTSFLKDNPEYICIEAKLVLKRENKKEIKDLMETRRQKRLLTQPLEYPSAGSVFRNPEGDFAGRLIEDCNLKGKMIGGAKVSSKHANFIINYDKASAKDVKDLITLVHDTVKIEKIVDVYIEQEFVNW